MLNIDKLLKKKGWTGSELGRLQIVTTLKGLQTFIDGEEHPEEIVSHADIRKMLDTLDPVEGAVYNGYIALHEWFRVTFPGATAAEQAAHLNYAKFRELITIASITEDIYLYISELPAIMTQKQYDDLVASRKQEILHPDGEPIGFNIFNLLEQAILYEVKQTDNNPRKKTLLKPLKKKLEKELVTDQRILSRYNEVMGEGYYTLEDGRRSDQMSREEWQEATGTLLDNLSNIEKQMILERRFLDKNSFIYSGMTDQEADEAQTEKDIELGLHKRCTWHYYEEPPADLTKWEVLQIGDLFNWYRSLESVCYDGKSYEESVLEDIEAFKKEFPELVETVLKDMEQYIKGASSIPNEEWVNTVYEWEDLYKADFYGFRKDYVDNDTSIFDGNRRALFNGVAILRPSDIINQSTRIDKETGYYKPPEIMGMGKRYGLEAYFTDNENYAENVEALEITRKQLLDNLYFMNGWNTSLDLIAKAFDLEEIKVGKLRLEHLKGMIEAYNALVKNLYREIKEMDYPDKELQKKKLEVLRDVLCPIDIERIKIPKEQIEKAKADMKDFTAFTDDSKDLRLTLCYPTEEL